MPAVTRRRTESHYERWTIFYNDIPLGTLGKRDGIALDIDHSQVFADNEAWPSPPPPPGESARQQNPHDFRSGLPFRTPWRSPLARRPGSA